MRLRDVSTQDFRNVIRRAESLRNAGVTTAYQEQANVTHWLIAGDVVGVSSGPLGTNGLYQVNVDELTPYELAFII